MRNNEGGREGNVMSLPKHHPPEEMLVEYASGSLSEGAALVLASHLTLCPGCRRRVADLEAIGGALLETVHPAALAPGCLEALMARLDQSPPPPSLPSPSAAVPCAQKSAARSPLLPQPLRRYVEALGSPTDHLGWQVMEGGLAMLGLGLSRGASAVHLMRLAPGAAVPHHDHDGAELILVLEGGYGDDRGQFGRGDFVSDTPGYAHTPRADNEGCLCVAFTERPLRFVERGAAAEAGEVDGEVDGEADGEREPDLPPWPPADGQGWRLGTVPDGPKH